MFISLTPQKESISIPVNEIFFSVVLCLIRYKIQKKPLRFRIKAF
jgi:hypothetical protein